MPDNFEENSSSRFKQMAIIVVVIALVLLNFFFIRTYTSSNSALINDFSAAENVDEKPRESAVAGLFYPANYYQLEKDVKGYLQNVEPTISKRPHMIIVPHAGYIYSAKVAAKAYQRLLPYAKEIKKVILVGPAHTVAIKGAALPSATSFKTPLGAVPTNKELINELASQPQFIISDRAHKSEHSLEVQLPFLQKTLGKFSIIPIVYGQIEPQVLADALQPLLHRNDTLLVISADLSHYFDDDTAKMLDNATAQMVENGQPLDEHQSCGAIGINTALLLAKKEGLHPQLLGMANSGEVNGQTDNVVGYAAWMFAKPEEAKPELPPLEQEVENLHNYADKYKKEMRRIVAKALAKAVNGKHYNPSRENYPDKLFDKGAAFVTLNIGKKLRGCIGSVWPSRAIAADLAENAYAAARQDDRFAPLTANELKHTKFTISLLSGYEPITFVSEEDLLRQIVAGKDGLVLRDGDRQGLFLPSVWEQLPTKKEFLNNLKIKAGLSPSYWSPKVKIFRFRTVEIKEK